MLPVKMKKHISLAILCFIGLSSFAQYEASNWYFGENAGITFDLVNNSLTPLTNGKLNTREGCASISDNAGHLLFYTDGVTVWNKNHEQMKNGTGLQGDSSSTQSAIIVPKPQDDNIYYVFTVDNDLNEINFGLNYSEIDITQDNGLGAITAKNINLLPWCSEKITAVLKDCITKSLWVVTLASENGTLKNFNTYHAYEVTSAGVNHTSVTSTFNISITDQRGYLKLAPNGTKIASANVRNGLYLYDFDITSGKLTNEQYIEIKSNNNGIFPYGVEFSPNSDLLYVHASNSFFDSENLDRNNDPQNHTSTLVQLNLNEIAIENTQVIIEENVLFRGALQLGPDGKIYRTLNSTYNTGTPYLGCIQNPNTVGIGCDYIHQSLSVAPNKTSQGLPPFVVSFFNNEIDIIKNGISTTTLDLCEGDTYLLTADDIIGATYVWTKDQVTLPQTSFEITIDEQGRYEVTIDPNNGDCTTQGQAFVNFTNKPEAFNHSLIQCHTEASNDGLTVYNLHEADDGLTGGKPGLSTTFYTDPSRSIEVDGEAFKNTSNPQTIYAKITNESTGCSSFSELLLEATTTQAKDAILPAVCDDDGFEDGIRVFNLDAADQLVTNGISASDLNITYYETYEDALLEVKPLNRQYTNISPYTQTVFARVENANNCYGISRVFLSVKALPDIITEDFLYYCLNTFPDFISIRASEVNMTASNFTYLWSTGEVTNNIQINQPNTYTVTVTNTYGCSKDRTVTVTPSSTAVFETIDVIDLHQNNTISVFVSGEGTYQYQLRTMDNTPLSSFQESHIFENVSPGIYNIHVKDIKNECGIVNQSVSVIGYPKFFTPNNDGYNDTWHIYGVSEIFQPDSKIMILNRFGKLIKTITPSDKGWDGTVNGNKLPSDDYWFVVNLQDGRTFKNHFTLKR